MELVIVRVTSLMTVAFVEVLGYLLDVCIVHVRFL